MPVFIPALEKSFPLCYDQAGPGPGENFLKFFRPGRNISPQTLSL